MNYIFSSILFILILISILVFKKINNYTWKEAILQIVSFLKENGYELSADQNYCRECNQIIKDILGDKRYEDLCKLNPYISTLFFADAHAGNPSVCITVKPSDDSERLQLSNILEAKTRVYLTNYRSDIETLVSWSENTSLGLPMLVIEYARNKKEADCIRQKKLDAAKTILTASTDVIDEEEDLL